MAWAERIVEMLLDAVCAVDRGGHFVFVNPAFEQLLGYPREELLGRRMMDFMHPEDLERTTAIAHAVMAGLSIRDFRNRYIRRDGAVLHVMWSARWSEDDQVRIAVARDMTPLVREEALKATALEISQAALENESLEWTWLRIEAAFERHLGGEAPVALVREADAVKRLGSVWATASDELINAAERTGLGSRLQRASGATRRSTARPFVAGSACTGRLRHGWTWTPRDWRFLPPRSAGYCGSKRWRRSCARQRCTIR